MKLQWQRFIGLCTSLKGLNKSHLFFWVTTNTAEKDRLGCKRDIYGLKGTHFTVVKQTEETVRRVKTSWKEASSLGEKKNLHWGKQLEKGSFGAFILPVLIPPHPHIMKRKRDQLQPCLLSTDRGKGSVDCEQSHPEDALPDHTNTNNEVEKENRP